MGVRINRGRLRAGVKTHVRGSSPRYQKQLFAGSLGFGNDFVETLIAAQRIPGQIETEIAV
jgi:hypothetical protein